MIGRQERRQKTLFIPGSIEDFIPDDHILKRVDRILDLSWLRDEVRGAYCEDNGRPGVDPESALRLMLAGFFQGIVHDRKLMREAQVNIAIRWFAGYGMDESLPDHSSLTRIRQRWGAERFKRIFIRVVDCCVKAGLVSGDTIHTDATLIRADVSWESLTTSHAEATLAANIFEEESSVDDVDSDGSCKRRGRPRSGRKSPKKRSITDPDATMATSSRGHLLEPSYKQHTAVDDKAGVIVEVEVTTGDESEGKNLVQMLDGVEDATGIKIERVTADAGYSHPANYQALEERDTDAIIPPQRMGRSKVSLPQRLFKYDAKHEVVCCPAGRKMRRAGRRKNGRVYLGNNSDCSSCGLRDRCVPRSAKVRTILIVDGYPSLLRARRLRALWDDETALLYSRHRWRVEGVHGEAKTQHGLRRAVRRGLDNVKIQAYLTAAVINLKRLAAFLWLYFRLFGLKNGHISSIWQRLEEIIRLSVDHRKNEICLQYPL